MEDLWTASVVAEAPADAESLPLSPDLDEHTELLLGELGVRPLLVAHGSDWWGIAFILDAPIPDRDQTEGYHDVVAFALRMTATIADKSGFPLWPVAKIEVLHGEGRPNIAPTCADPEQAWYWTPEWQAGERRAAEEIASNRVEHYGTDEEFLNAL